MVRLFTLRRWVAAGVRTASPSSHQPLTAPSSSVGSLLPSTALGLMRRDSGDVETKKVQITWTLGSGVNNQQVGNTWTAGDSIVSLSMSGDLNVFDKRVGDKPARVLYVSPASKSCAFYPLNSPPRPHLHVDRALKRRSRPRSRRRRQTRRSSSALPMAAYLRTQLSTSISAGRHTRPSSPASASPLQVRSTP